MDTLYVTLYTGAETLVNAQLLHVYDDRLDVRLSSELRNIETIYATFWLNPTPVNCHVRILSSSEDPATGELLASLIAVDLDREERRLITSSLLGLHDYVRLRSVS